MSRETPLQTMKRLYGTKDKLIESVVDAAKAAGEETSELKERLASQSNRKLLRLLEVSRAVKEKYGGREKLIGSLSAAVGKAKDSDYVEKLRSFTSPRLLDLVRSAERRSRNAAS